MSFIQDFFSWVRRLIKGIPKQIREYAEIALKVTSKIKQVIDSGIVVTITDLTPTDIDDNIRTKLSECLGILNEWLEVRTLPEAIEALKLMPKKLQNATLIKLASEIASCLDNHDMRESDYDVAVQSVYSNGKLS